jgi:hypothetical protein
MIKGVVKKLDLKRDSAIKEDLAYGSARHPKSESEPLNS